MCVCVLTNVLLLTKLRREVRPTSLCSPQCDSFGLMVSTRTSETSNSIIAGLKIHSHCLTNTHRYADKDIHGTIQTQHTISMSNQWSSISLAPIMGDFIDAHTHANMRSPVCPSRLVCSRFCIWGWEQHPDTLSSLCSTAALTRNPGDF